MITTDLLSELRDDVLHLTLNRPEQGNGVSDEMAHEIARVMRTADEHARVVVLRANGPDFCLGRASMGKPPPGPPGEALARRRSTEVIFDCYQSFRDCNVPVIGVVHGRAFGFGASIAALCDITLASDAATFQIPEMNHNIFPTMVLSALVDRVAPKDAAYLVLTREIVSAERARDMKIASEVVAASALDDRVDQLLALFATTPKAALQATKEFVRSAYDMPTRGAIDFARNLHATINSAVEMRKL